MRILAQITMSLAVLAVLVSLSPLAAQESWVGVWKLNMDKSPRSPDRPQSQVVTLRSEDGMVAMTEENVTAKGMPYQVSFKGALDSKDYPVTGSIAGIAFISGTMLGPDTIELKAKKKDRTVLATYWVVHSADGKMRMTLAWIGPEVAGPPSRVAIHDRQ